MSIQTKTTRRTLGRLGVLLTCAMMASSVAGCSSDEDEPKVDDSPYTGKQIAQGLLGVGRGDKGAEANVAAQIVDDIEVRFSGRLAQVELEMKSGDPQRILAAKKMLDESIDAVAGSEKYPTEADIADATDEVSPTSFSPGGLVPLNGGLVEAPVSLTCEALRDRNGRLIRIGRGGNGRYGDDRTGVSGAARDTADLVDTTDLNVLRTLRRVDSGELRPDPESRLGAYAATRGYRAGTVGYAVHNAIGTIYAALANYGQEKIGRVFNSSQARALYNQPVASCASYQIAAIEYLYWDAVRREDSFSPGGNLGSVFSPRTRDLLQRNLFGYLGPSSL